ncbi:phage tail tube protein [Bosea sp. 685]|uniref:phage tail tube protein n=1 Tax=Bosea sp. 685 TaxID=3080057 RepID=UPI002892A184|nr:phage tail tube protein [Bosea sp. 685]WNJ89170.1 phage tail tube protein [Bosea sp. 685]
MTQVLGIVDIVWKGRNVPVEKGAKFKLGGIGNKAVVYGRKVGRAGEYMQSEIEATTPLERNQRVSDLYTNEEGELQVVCDTGQTYVFPDAFLTDLRELTGGEGGKIGLKWAAGDYEEISA